YADLITAAGLAEIATYANAIGPDKSLVIPRKPDETLGTPTNLISNAHAQGLEVHAWTFRAENAYLPKEYRSGTSPAGHGDLSGELGAFLRAGLDGFFTDHPDLGVRSARAFA